MRNNHGFILNCCKELLVDEFVSWVLIKIEGRVFKYTYVTYLAEMIV
jgi:hypothetical protein